MNPQNIKTPLVACDCIVLNIQNSTLKVLLIKLAREPYKDKWALPGGLVKIDETLRQTALRYLNQTESAAKKIYLDQLYVYSDIKRDPRQRVISIAFLGIVRKQNLIKLKESEAYSENKWFEANQLPEMAYDHKNMLELAIKRIRDKAERSVISLQFLPASFTLTEMQKIYETLLGHSLDKRNFRKKTMALGLVKPLAKQRHEGRGRPAEVFRVAK